MKTKSNHFIIQGIATAFMMLFFLSLSANTTLSNDKPNSKESKNNIKVALLLDTSNSMDGLISQAKSQLWSIINKLSEASINGKKPTLQIALYEYGNDRLSSENGYVRRVLSFSNDLDLLSEKLFALTTNGGNEYCGQVIQKSIKELEWSGNDDDLRLIIIAGNEPFNQGKICYKKSSNLAKDNSIVINPIFCGDFDQGIRTFWKDAAEITNGKYMSIEQDRKTVYIKSPYDDDILELNKKLNETYIPYGSTGKKYKERQMEQDRNASSYGAVNFVKRAISKSKVVYNNATWDLVDAVNESKIKIDELEKKSLPKDLQNLSKKELEIHISNKLIKRKAIQKEINKLNLKREKFVNEKNKTQSNIENLENALINSIEKQAVKKGYKF